MPTTYSPYSISASAATAAAFSVSPFGQRLFILQPAIVFQAQVDLAAPDYPIAALPYKNVAVGSYEDVQAGMTLVLGETAGDDDWGRQRVRKVPTADTIYVGRSSRGTRDGELRALNNAWITVWDDHRVWSRLPYIDPAQVFMPQAETPLWVTYKDGDIEVGDNTINPPPVANCGPGTAATINPVTGLITVAFDGTASFAVAEEATITTYAWDVKDGTITVGLYSDPQITATFPPGFRWVSLTVIDSNGKGHIARCPVYARDPANDDSIEHFQVTEHSFGRAGQRLAFKILQVLPRASYPDGTLVLFWDGEPSGPADRSHMQFIGWHHSDPTEIRAAREGVTRDTVLHCLDVAGKLDTLPGLPQIINSDALRAVLYDLPAITWEFMPSPTWNKWLHYLLHWHSTALHLADWQWMADGATYPFVTREAQAATLYRQIDEQAQSVLPDHYLTCDRLGKLWVLPDPAIVPLPNRTTAEQAVIGAEDWQDITFVYNRFADLYWLWSSAVGVQEEPAYLDPAPGQKPRLRFPTFFSAAPGDAPGQGVQQSTTGNKLARSQAELNICEGNRYGRINARHERLRITLAHGDDKGIEPAHMSWVTLQVPAQFAPQRGLRFTEARGLVHEVSIRYDYRKEGMVKTVEMEWEREVFPLAAVTVTPPVTPPAATNPFWPPITFQPPEPVVAPETPDQDLFYDPIKGYILWSSTHVLRTWDLLAASPTWEDVGTGISGTIYDGQYTMVNSTTVGMWLMTSTAIWWCADIMAVTPSWAEVLPIATVQAADAVPATGTVEFKTMYNYATEPGYLCVATGPRAADTENSQYAHAYFWHTHDYGANWTQVDADNLLYSSTLSGATHTRGYCYSSLYAMNIFRSAPGTIYCMRTTPRTGLNFRTRVLLSRDLGHTWELAPYVISNYGNQQDMSLLNPYPAATDPSYLRLGPVGASLRTQLHISTDEWVSGTQLTANGTPSGYGGLGYLWRPNKRTFDNDHVMAWFRHTDSTHMRLLESYNRGGTWGLLLDSGTGEKNIIGKTPAKDYGAAAYNTPNGWPPDPNVWILVRAAPLAGTTNVVPAAIQITLDNFQTLIDKAGNLETIIGVDNWQPGANNGFALPKVGINA
jgi:hypothetical protein